VQRNPKRFLFIFHSFSPPSRSVIGAFFGHAKLLCRCVLFGQPFLALVNHSSSSHYPTQESSGCSVGTLCAWRWQTAAGRCWAAPCAPRVPFPTTCKLPAVLIPFPVLSLMLDVSANLLLSTPPRGQDSGGSAFFHLPFPLNSFSSPFLAGFPLAPASPAPRPPTCPHPPLCCTSSFPYRQMGCPKTIPTHPPYPHQHIFLQTHTKTTLAGTSLIALILRLITILFIFRLEIKISFPHPSNQQRMASKAVLGAHPTDDTGRARSSRLSSVP